VRARCGQVRLGAAGYGQVRVGAAGCGQVRGVFASNLSEPREKNQKSVGEVSLEALGIGVSNALVLLQLAKPALFREVKSIAKQMLCATSQVRPGAAAGGCLRQPIE
jgi:hypothetical protein